jgi:hypothetical protein
MLNDYRMTHPPHTRRIMRALADPSPFTGPILFAPVNPNLPPPSTAIGVDIDTRLAPLAPTAAEEARNIAIPEAPTRDVGARRLDGRRKPLAPAADTLDDDGTACVAICLFR